MHVRCDPGFEHYITAGIKSTEKQIYVRKTMRTPGVRTMCRNTTAIFLTRFPSGPWIHNPRRLPPDGQATALLYSCRIAVPPAWCWPMTMAAALYFTVISAMRLMLISAELTLPSPAMTQAVSLFLLSRHKTKRVSFVLPMNLGTRHAAASSKDAMIRGMLPSERYALASCGIIFKRAAVF